jgi:hypothetical protein
MSAAFEHSWVKLYSFILGALGLPVGFLDTVSIFFDRVSKIHRSRGKVGLGMYLKESQRCLLQYLAKTPQRSSSVGLVKGLPSILPGVIRKGILEGNMAAIRTALTLIGFVRTVYHKGVIKTSNITDPTTWDPSQSKRNRMMKEVRLALKWLRVRAFVAPKVPVLGVKSNRQGPNGHATLAAHWDAFALQGSILWGSFQELCQLLGSQHLIPRVEALASVTAAVVNELPFLTSVLPLHFASLGKLGVKDEPCGKKRVFAISDYWTQTVCKPLHDYLMKVLRALPMDGTWDQGAASDQVAKWTATNQKLYCFDLSAATDRFPGGFIAMVLSVLIGDRAAALWLHLLTARDYWYKGAAYRYSAGQPMGTLSSWAGFALAHHVVVQIAAMRAGYDKLFQNYVLLGDDIVIADDDVAEEYRDLMTWFQVSINDSKSLVGVGVAEFAKRHFLRGQEVSGMPGSLILLAGTRLSGLRVLVDVALRRGWGVSGQSLLASIFYLLPSIGAVRKWRFVLVSLLGPGAPLSVTPALWGGLLSAAPEILLGTLQGVLGGFSRLPSLQRSPGTDLIGPCNEIGGLVEEIYRHFEIKRIRKARESHAKWIATLSGNLESLLKGWILSAPDRDASGSTFEFASPRLIRWARELIECGHPAASSSLMTEPLETEHSEMEIMDLSVQLSRGDRLAPAVWGLAPSGDLALLQSASKDTHWGMSVIKSVTATSPLAFEWQEPGAIEMIREGLTLEIGEVLKDSLAASQV